LETGTVIKSVGMRYKVLLGTGHTIECTLKGRLRVKELRNTNPVAVGDNVEIEITGIERTGVITGLLDRKNYILRKSSRVFPASVRKREKMRMSMRR